VEILGKTMGKNTGEIKEKARRRAGIDRRRNAENAEKRAKTRGKAAPRF